MTMTINGVELYVSFKDEAILEITMVAAGSGQDLWPLLDEKVKLLISRNVLERDNDIEGSMPIDMHSYRAGFNDGIKAGHESMKAAIELGRKVYNGL